MKKMYLIFALLFSCCSFSFAQAVATLSGQVTEPNGQPVGFANVAVLEASSAKVVTGAIADMDGKFLIKTPAAGTYKLRVNGLGYLELLTPTFTVDSPGFSQDFGQLQVQADVKTLSEVQVQTLRPTITTEPDKMVVSVENTAMAEGNTAYDVLAKSPGVWVDQDGNLQLNGKGGVQVMLNGRRSYLSGKELQNLLQNMPAENLKNLELITNPSSRYDAEGASGIININLKKNQDSGMSGSVYAGYQYNSRSTYTSGAEVSHKKGNWNSFGSINLNRRMRYRDMEMDRVFMSESGTAKFDQTGSELNERLEPSLRLGTEYDLNERHSIGGVGSLTMNRTDMAFRTASYLRNGDNLYIDALNQANEEHANGTFNLHYLGKLDTTGTTLSADLDYVHIGNTDEASFTNKFFTLPVASNPDSVELLRNENPTRYDIVSAKVDFATTLNPKLKLELGAKASHVKSDNELRFYEVQDERETFDSKRSNHFIYKETIYAAYTSLSATLSDTWSLQAGLRAEQTFSLGNSLTKKEKTNRDNLNLFPTLFVQQKVSDNYQIGYKYSRRISRPYYQNLNPFIFYLDPYTYAQGNPQLKPQYINSFELTQTFKQAYTLVLGYTLTKDLIGEVPEQDPVNNTTIFQQRNIEDAKSATATLVAPIKVSGKWEISNNLTGMYQEFTTVTQIATVVNEQFSLIANSNHTVLLPKGFRLEAGANYQSAVAFSVYKVEPQWWLDAGLKRTFLDDKLSLALNVSDVFKSRIMRAATDLNGNRNAIEQYWGQRGVRLNIRYRFSKGAKFETRKRSTNLDELNRAGGN